MTFYFKFCILTLAAGIVVLSAEHNNLPLSSLAIGTAAAKRPSSYPYSPLSCPIIDAPFDIAFFPSANDCSSYYTCWRGKMYLNRCPAGLHFSARTKSCEDPIFAQCPNFPASSDGQPIPPYYQPDSMDCTKYYRIMHCPPGYAWNDLLQSCDPTAYAECMSSAVPFETPSSSPVIIPPTAPSNTIATSFPYQTISDSDNAVPEATRLNELCKALGTAYIPYPGDCHKYIQCNGAAIVRECPGNLFWNSKLLTCDYYCA